MLRAANIVLTPETVATYLAQMWISNIMQTVGWGLVASFFSTANGRLVGPSLSLSIFYQNLIFLAKWSPHYSYRYQLNICQVIQT